MSGAIDPYELILSKLQRKRRCGKGVVTLCPAHDDKRFSLSVARGRNNNVVMKCHAGCPIEAICAGFGITKSDLFSGGGKKRNSDWDIIAVYDYHNQEGRILYQHVRYRNKHFTWRGPDSQGDWRYGLYAGWFEQWTDGDWRAVKDENKDILGDPAKKPHTDARWFDAITERVLYKEAQIRRAPPGSLALYLEGEKDVETAIRMGFLATTAGSASDWRPEFAALFAGHELVIIPDNDSAGERLAQKVASDNCETAESVRITRLPGLAAHGDLTDWLETRVAEGCNLTQAREQLLTLIEETRLWEPELERDEFIDKAVQEAQRAINRAATEMDDEDSDPLLTEDKAKDTKLRSLGWDAARVVDMVVMLLAALGFEGNHHRLINALIAIAKRLPRPLVYFTATHAQVYAKYRRAKTIKERSKSALVGSDVTKLREEMDALGYMVVDYIKGGIAGFDTPEARGYGSRFRLQILRFALIAINLADRVKDEFKTRSQADEWAVQQVAEMIPRLEPVVKAKTKTEKAEAQGSADFESVLRAFLEAAKVEFDRVVDKEVAKPGTVDSLSEQIDSLAARIINRINKMGSEALYRGVEELAEMEREGEPVNENSLVHETMDQGRGQSEVDWSTNNTTSSRNEDIRTSMPDAPAPLVDAELPDEFFETAVMV